MYEIDKISVIAAKHYPKAPTKARAWDTVKYLFDNVERADGSDPEYFEQQLAALYSHFMPRSGKIPKTGEEWVIKARGKDDIRYYLNHVYSDGNRLIATDGHRVHIMVKSLEPGFYDDNLQKVHDTDYGKFPEIDRVIPSRKGKERNFKSIMDEALADIKFVQGGNPNRRGDLEAVSLGGNGGYVNRQYFEEAMSGFDEDEKIRVYQQLKNTAVKLTQGDRLAVIMPIKV